MTEDGWSINFCSAIGSGRCIFPCWQLLWGRWWYRRRCLWQPSFYRIFSVLASETDTLMWNSHLQMQVAFSNFKSCLFQAAVEFCCKSHVSRTGDLDLRVGDRQKSGHAVICCYTSPWALWKPPACGHHHALGQITAQVKFKRSMLGDPGEVTFPVLS